MTSGVISMICAKSVSLGCTSQVCGGHKIPESSESCHSPQRLVASKDAQCPSTGRSRDERSTSRPIRTSLVDSDSLDISASSHHLLAIRSQTAHTRLSCGPHAHFRRFLRQFKHPVLVRFFPAAASLVADPRSSSTGSTRSRTRVTGIATHGYSQLTFPTEKFL